MPKVVLPLFLCGLNLAGSAAVRAGAVIELVPQNPGPYFGGERVAVDVFVSGDRFVLMRLFQLDFSATDQALTLDGPDGPDPGTKPEFVFDLTPTQRAILSVFQDFPRPTVVYAALDAEMFALWLPIAPQTLHVGSLEVLLPNLAGDYVLDAMNALDPDVNHGATLAFDFADIQWWRAYDDGNVELIGGRYTFTVISEPATLALLALGAVAAVWLRRRGPGRRNT